MMYIGGMLMQYPLGYLSDRMDRRFLIIGITGLGGVILLLGSSFTDNYTVLLVLAFAMGGIANPLYSLLIASVAGPVLVGYLMSRFGADSYFSFIAILFLSITAYGLFRMTQRAAPAAEDTGQYAAVAPQASPVFVEVAQEYAIDLADEEALEEADGTEDTAKPE